MTGLLGRFLLTRSTNGHNDMVSDAPFSAATLASLLCPGFRTAVAVPAVVTDALFPEERDYIARAVEKRQAEFGTARVCARRALAQLGLAPCSLLPNRDRSPHWPAGVIGSISHTEGCCAAAVTNDPTIIGVGIDLEQDTGLSPELEPLICTAEERAWLACQDQDTRPWLAKVFFSAKEAFYKCQYGTTHTVLDFLDVELNIDPCSCSFSLRRMTRADAHWGRLSSTAGKFQRVAGLIVTAAILTGEPA